MAARGDSCHGTVGTKNRNDRENLVMTAPASRLTQVVETWLPRFQVAGIPELDARRVIAAAGDWPSWCRAWSEEAGRHLKMAEEAERAGRLITAGEALVRAA